MSNSTTSNPKSANTLLFEHFATLATAPDGIARLRELILQLAVQGKLGTQDAGDEPASVLLEKIRKEKERLVKSGEIKNDGKYEPIKKDEISFSIPKTWQWIRLGELTQKIGSGSTPKGGRAVYQENGIKFIRSQNVWNDGLYLEGIARISNEIHQTMDFTVVQPRDILLNITGASIGRSCIVPDNFDEGNVNQHVSIIRTVDKKIRSYLHYCIISPYFQNRIMDVQVGMSREGLSKKVLKDLLIPFPPLAEQYRIIAKVDRLMALCDELEARQQQERAGCLKLGTASLAGLQNAESPEEFGRQWAQVCDAFDLILDCPENVAVLRQTILQLAVQGRLVRQDPGDEPASKLLSKEKNDPVQTTDILFDLPSGWIGTRCVSLCEKNRIITYGVIKLGSEISDGVPVLRSSDVKFLHINDFKVKRIDPSIAAQYQRTFLIGGEIVINVRGTLGGIAVVPRFMKGYNISREVAVIPIISKISEKYIAYALASPFCQNWLSKNLKGIAYSGINIADLKLLPVPLPPFAEQHRIVAKVDALMALCDALESRLKERAGVQGRLAGAVVRQVAGEV